MGPHSLLDEGIDQVLDFLQEEAAMNSLMIYSHTYYSSGRKPLRVLAHDHATPPRDLNQRRLPMSWVRHREGRFDQTPLRHQTVDRGMEYHDRDIFAEIRQPAERRGMKVLVRMLEPGASSAPLIQHYDQVLVEDIYGQPGAGPCWNHPDYRNWVYATMEDIFSQYEIDGLQYGAERTGPLSEVWLKGAAPACFCIHCQVRNGNKGIDHERAREGYRLLHTFVRELAAGQYTGVETVSTMFWRFLQQYPEILAWNYQWFQADEEIQQEMYLRIKRIQPGAIVGRHVDHQRSSWDPFYRSAVSYEEMAAYADFVKPILYHDIFGPRLRWWVIDTWRKHGFKDFSDEQLLDLFYTMMGYSPEARVALDRLEMEGMGPAYVYDETRRCVAGVNGKAEVVAGIGIDVLWHGSGQQPYFSDPHRLQQAVFKAVEAGASGLLASREYDEMRWASLRAFGEAVRQLSY